MKRAAAISPSGILAVTAADETTVAAAQRLADELRLPYAPHGRHAGVQLLLVQTPTHLELRHPPRKLRMHVSITPADLARGRITRRDPFARALGPATIVVDATAGFGRDTILIACLGYRVIALERSPAVAALLRDGIARACAAGVLAHDRIELRHTDALLALPAMQPPDVVYLDPMFGPKRKKSAAVRKELRLLRELVGEDHDGTELLAVARASAPRVVVKRALDAPALAPDHAACYRGKLVRYDVYRGVPAAGSREATRAVAV